MLSLYVAATVALSLSFLLETTERIEAPTDALSSPLCTSRISSLLSITRESKINMIDDCGHTIENEKRADSLKVRGGLSSQRVKVRVMRDKVALVWKGEESTTNSRVSL